MLIETVSIESWTPWLPADLRQNLRLGSTAEDPLFAGFLAAATRHAEQRTKMSILGRRLTVSLPAFPAEYLELPAPPLRYADGASPTTAIASSVYQDVANVTQPWPAGLFVLRKDAQVWRLEKTTSVAPEVAKDEPRAVRVTFDVGFRDLSHMQAEAPDLRDAIMLLASHRSTNREATINEPRVMMVSRKIELSFDAMIAPYIVQTRHVAGWA